MSTSLARTNLAAVWGQIQSAANNTGTVVLANNLISPYPLYSTNFVTSTGVYTVQSGQAGLYQLSMSAQYGSSGTAGGSGFLAFVNYHHSSTTYTPTLFDFTSTSSIQWGFSGTIVIPAVATDTFSFAVQQGSGGTINIFCYCSIIYLGAS